MIINNIDDATIFFFEMHHNSNFIKNITSFYKHCKGVSEISYNTAEKLREDKIKLAIAGILHDIGKFITDDLYNETHIGASYLEEKGL